MTIWELHTNEGRVLVRQQPTRKQMLSYVHAKRKAGVPLRNIIFAWGPKALFHSAKPFVLKAKQKAAP